MSLTQRFLRDWQSGTIGAVIASVTGVVLLVFHLAGGMERLSYDLPFAFRSDRPVTNVVLVAMDDPSHKKLDQPYDKAWDRKLHAQLLQWLTAAGALGIGYDVEFPGPGPDSEADRQLAAALQHASTVVLAASMDQTELRTVNAPTDAFRRQLRHGWNWGVSNLPEDYGDRTIRRHPTGAGAESGLAWRLAEELRDPPPQNPANERWINYYGRAGNIPRFSFYQVISNEVPAGVFAGKIVFVGAQVTKGHSAGRRVDSFPVPYSRWHTLMPGAEIHANVFLNLLWGNWLNEPSPLSRCGLFLLTGVVFGYGLTRFRPAAAAGVAVAGALLVALGAFLMVWWLKTWFPWLLISAVQIPVALGWVVLANVTKVLSLQEAFVRAGAPASAEGVTPPVGAGREDSNPAFSTANATRPVSSASPGSSVPHISDHELHYCIGKGAYGEVWLARNAIGTFHAVKIVHRRSFAGDAPYDREFRGIQKYTPISRAHPGWVQVLHVGRNDPAGYFYYVMELGDDETRGQEIDPQHYAPKDLARELRRLGKLPAGEALDLGLALSDALEYLHQHQLIHRDIKPGNVIFVENRPKLADIGLVTDLAPAGRNVSIVGTLGYMAPEGPGTVMADVYSLGKVLYEASMGRDRELFPEFPTTITERPDLRLLMELHEVISRACETDPRERYPSAAEMHADLLRLKSESGSESRL